MDQDGGRLQKTQAWEEELSIMGLITLNLSYPLVIQGASQEGNLTSGMKLLIGESSAYGLSFFSC